MENGETFAKRVSRAELSKPLSDFERIIALKFDGGHQPLVAWLPHCQKCTGAQIRGLTAKLARNRLC
jgi:hypothetical protein